MLHQGWGCGYRTLQTLCSWILRCQKREHQTKEDIQQAVPSIPSIQKILIEIGDKTPEFYGSRDWIGSFEVMVFSEARLFSSLTVIYFFMAATDTAMCK